MSVRRFRPVSLIVAMALLAACNSPTGDAPQIGRYGAISIFARSASATQAVGAANAIFFEALSVVVPNSATQQSDQCVIAPVDTTTQNARGQNRVGGLSVEAGGTTFPLAFNETALRYETATLNTITYTAGASATVAVPGNGSVFPASSITVKLAEPIVPAVAAAPVRGQPWPVTWNGTNDGTAAVLLSLRYAFPSNSTFANEQVYCTLRDDGAFSIPAVALEAFLSSPSALRSLRMTRFRTNEVRPDNRTLLFITTAADSGIAVP